MKFQSYLFVRQPVVESSKISNTSTEFWGHAGGIGLQVVEDCFMPALYW